jgi:hypothetical protein
MSSKLLAIAFAAVAVVFAAVFLLPLLFGGHGRTISSVIQRYEFTELTPPSTLVPPGTIVTVIKEDPLVVGVICPAADSLGTELQARLLSSDSASSKQAAEFTGEFQLDASARGRVTSQTDSRFVRNITVTLSNVKIIELPDSVVFDLIGSRKDGCGKALKFRRDEGKKVSMIKSVVMATAVYRVQFDGNLKADARAQVTRGIASSLGLTNGVKSDDSIQGDGLIWGVRDDVSLAAISQNGPPPTGASTHPRALPTDKVAKVVSDAN